jgi:hypothetical protein
MLGNSARGNVVYMVCTCKQLLLDQKGLKSASNSRLIFRNKVREELKRGGI